MQLILFFMSPKCKIASAARNGVNAVPQTAATTYEKILYKSFFYDHDRYLRIKMISILPPPPLIHQYLYIYKRTQIQYSFHYLYTL